MKRDTRNKMIAIFMVQTMVIVVFVAMASYIAGI